MNLENLSETELKAYIYDQLTIREQAQINMQAADQELVRRRQTQTNEVKLEKASEGLDLEKPEGN